MNTTLFVGSSPTTGTNLFATANTGNSMVSSV